MCCVTVGLKKCGPLASFRNARAIICPRALYSPASRAPWSCMNVRLGAEPLVSLTKENNSLFGPPVSTPLSPINSTDILQVDNSMVFSSSKTLVQTLDRWTKKVSSEILIPRGHSPFVQHQESWPLASSKREVCDSWTFVKFDWLMNN